MVDRNVVVHRGFLWMWRVGLPGPTPYRLVETLCFSKNKNKNSTLRDLGPSEPTPA